MFTIVNKSTRVTDAEVKLMVRAIAYQVRHHACPLYGLTPESVVFSADESTAPAGSYCIAILDDSDQQGALGWHTEDKGDVIYGEVFAGPVLDNGGNALTADLSVASVLSHEVLETLCDPHANLYADNGHGVAYAYEACDAVESDSYPITVYGTKVTVSNFVTPHWFDPDAATGERFDYLGNVTAPFQMTKGGYVITMTEGKVSQHFGEKFPEWRKGIKARPNASARAIKRDDVVIPNSVSPKVPAATAGGAFATVIAYLLANVIPGVKTWPSDVRLALLLLILTAGTWAAGYLKSDPLRNVTPKPRG